MVTFRFYFCLIVLITAASSKGAPLQWLAFGDIRGHIEPCGCNPKTDLGGVLRLGQLVSRYRLANPQVLLFDLGNHFSSDSNKNLQNAFIAKAIKALHPDGILFNVLDAKQIQLLKDQNTYVLSNGTEMFYKNYPFVKKDLQIKDLRVFGFFSQPEKDNNFISAAAALNIFASYKKDSSKILLFSGNKKDLDLFISSKLFSLILVSNQAPFSTYPGVEEKNEPSRLMLDQNTQMVPLGGLGILKSPGLKEPASSLLLTHQTSFQEKKSDFFEAPKSDQNFLDDLNKKDGSILWLDSSFETKEGVFAQILSDYHVHAKNFYEKLAEAKEKDLLYSSFAGAKSCKLCHAKAYDVWKESKHQRAFETLETQSKHQIPECVGCHVLGFAEKGGFISKDKTPDFKGVQCENCHGARKEHMLDPSKKPPHSLDPKTVCQNCHHSPHSPDFRFDSYWPKITH